MSDQPAAREEGQFYVDVGNKIKELEAQLAAEREARKVLGPTFTDEELGRWADEDAILKNQLAAERYKVDNATENCMSLSKLLYEAKQQLAAELEKQIICPHCGWEFVDRMALEREESEKH